MQLGGFHHLTAVTADAARNHAFYTETLGMRLVKKTVNQDDVSAYHLFYGDGLASPGTDLTFFAWPAARERRGTRSIVRTGLRVAGEGALEWWAARFKEKGVVHSSAVERDGRMTLDFEDPEGQRLSLVDDGGHGPAHPWEASAVPAERQVRGLGPITISVPEPGPTEALLTDVLEMRRAREYSSPYGEGSTLVYEMGEGGPGAELHVAVEPRVPVSRAGAGGVHHLALRAPGLTDYENWIARLQEKGIPSSGPVERYYFKSLYFREPSGILFEIATDEPGFTVDEPLETLGGKLALPPFLESRRRQIESGLKPL